MIQSFANRETERIWNGQRSRKLPFDIQVRALAKLAMIDAAESVDDLKTRPAIAYTNWIATVLASIPFQLIGNGVYVSSGKADMRTMSKSSTTTDPNWLHNPHAGELLMSEFMEPLGLDTIALADAIAVDPSRVDAVIRGSARIDGELDLRLARYLRMSDGFFLRLQDQYELREAKRALNGDLERIVPRAA